MSESLVEAQTHLRGQVLNGGARCPCCRQFAKVYERKLNAGMAVSLIRMYRVRGGDWVHLPTEVPARSREEGKLAYWGLVVEARTERPDGGRAGYWRLTPDGLLFVQGDKRVPKYAKVYDGRCLGLTGELVSIRNCLGDRFDYDELMSR
jgi:hypothetical protein